MPPSVTWSFAAVPHVDVQCPRALDNGVARILGKRWDADAHGYVVAEPSTYTLSKREAAGLRAFFAKHLKAGELLAANATTAEAFGVKESSLWPVESALSALP